MFFALRVVRGIFGAVFALQILQVLEALLLLVTNYEAVNADIGKYFALLLIKTVVLAVAGFVFFWLRKLINNLHEKKYGEPHPSLATKKWNL